MNKLVYVAASAILMFGLTACQRKVTSEEAKKIALEDAKVKEAEVTFTSEGMEDDEYVFHFQNTSNSYFYEISKSGKIEEKQVISMAQNMPEVTKDKTGSSNQKITQDEALQIAYEKFQVSSENVKNVKVKLDKENGIEVYDIDFDAGNKEYSCDISTTTGEILNFDSDAR